VDYRLFFKGDYIAAAEFQGKEPTLTIAAVKLVKLEDETGRLRDRGVVYFRETDRGWVINRTNAECLVALWGRDTDGWAGKRVTLCATNVRLGTETTIGIRIKGSPDLAAPLDVVVKLPRKKPFTIRLLVTKAGPASAAERKPGEEG